METRDTADWKSALPRGGTPGYEISGLRVYIAHLREKLESNPELPELILTELGVGYRFLVKE